MTLFNLSKNPMSRIVAGLFFVVYWGVFWLVKNLVAWIPWTLRTNKGLWSALIHKEERKAREGQNLPAVTQQ